VGRAFHKLAISLWRLVAVATLKLPQSFWASASTKPLGGKQIGKASPDCTRSHFTTIIEFWESFVTPLKKYGPGLHGSCTLVISEQVWRRTGAVWMAQLSINMIRCSLVQFSIILQSNSWVLQQANTPTKENDNSYILILHDGELSPRDIRWQCVLKLLYSAGHGNMTRKDACIDLFWIPVS
jgi:hypothetical protein